jgi:SAM-dependent methyltransferase
MPELCPLCSGRTKILTAPHAWHSMVSDGRLMSLPMVRRSCLQCGAASHLMEASKVDIKAIYSSEYGLPAAAPAADAARGVAYADWIAEQILPPRSVLEIGCGSGAMLTTLLEHWPAATGTGTDPALPVGSTAKERLRLYRGFLDNLPDTATRFDLIVAINVIEHTSDPKEFLATLQARLSPRGQIVIVCPTADPPNIELLFYDHIFSLTPHSLGRIAASLRLTAKKIVRAPATLGDFQMLVFNAGNPPVAAAQNSAAFSMLAADRESYLEGWRDLDCVLLERMNTSKCLVAFGGGQTACLLRAYAPKTWSRVEMIVLDDASEAWKMNKPIEAYANAMPRLVGANVLIATAPRVQAKLAVRLEQDGLRPIRYDDLIER